MSFKNFFLAMRVPERCAYAATCSTTYNYLKMVAYGGKTVDLGMADVLVAVAKGKISLDDIPLSDKAKRFRALREKHGRGWRVRPSTAAVQSAEARA